MLVLFSFRNCGVVFSSSRFWLCLFLACEADFVLFVLAVWAYCSRLCAWELAGRASPSVTNYLVVVCGGRPPLVVARSKAYSARVARLVRASQRLAFRSRLGCPRLTVAPCAFRVSGALPAT